MDFLTKEQSFGTMGDTELCTCPQCLATVRVADREGHYLWHEKVCLAINEGIARELRSEDN